MNIAQHLASLIKCGFNSKHVFTLTGGGAMFLNDAFGNENNLKAIYCHHEQAASMAAVGYAKLNGFAACITTTGCGATNTMTGLLDAWQDNVPVLFISGQVKRKETSFLFQTFKKPKSPKTLLDKFPKSKSQRFKNSKIEVSLILLHSDTGGGKLGSRILGY